MRGHQLAELVVQLEHRRAGLVGRPGGHVDVQVDDAAVQVQLDPVEAAALAEPDDEGTPPPLRVPSAAGAYASPCQLSQSGGWASAVIEGARPSLSPRTSMLLQR